MSPDHTPYLRPGVDLITAEDACAWLDGLTSGPARERIYGVLDAHAALSLRLDRERRQACRRAALDCWRDFRAHPHQRADLARYAALVSLDAADYPTRARAAVRPLLAALAFRAAARA